MSTKKDTSTESDSPYDAALEQHIDEMLAPDTPDAPKSKKIAITHHGEEVTASVSKTEEPEPEAEASVPVFDEPLPGAAEAASAPVVPGAPIPKEPFKITVFHDEAEPEPAPAPEVKSKSKKKVEIAEATDEEMPPLEMPKLPIETAEEEAVAGPDSEEETPVAEPAPEEAPTKPTSTIKEIAFDEPEAPVLEEAFNDEKTEQLVNDIIAKEGDEILAAEDAKAELSGEARQAKALPKQVHEASPWQWAWLRWALFWLILIGIAVAVITPTSRYYALNKVGVQSTASVTVTDRSSLQPLKNVTVKIADQTAQTDAKGVARLAHLHLGPTKLTIEKRAFSSVTQNITIGWGSNPLPNVDLAPTGTQYTFTVTDYVTGKPVITAAASSQYADANADNKGAIKLTLDNDENHDKVSVTIKADGYRDEQLELTSESPSKADIKLVTSHKHAYVSKRSGTYDVYATDIDGKNEKVVLAGTGSEGSDMVLAPSGGSLIAVVSVRDNAKDKAGNVLSTLTVVDIASGSTAKVSQAAQIHLVSWSNGRLAYVQVASGVDENNPDRERLMSYDFTKRDNKQLTSANTFNDVMAVGENIYYAPAAGNSDPTGSLTRIKFDGSNKQVILSAEVWNAFRTDYEHLTISVPGSWWQHTIGTADAHRLDAQPTNTTSRGYVDSSDGKHSLWVEKQNGKGVLRSYDVGTKQDTVLLTQTGLQYPVTWLDNSTVIYRIATDSEVADYVMSLNGGSAHKIHDVSPTGSKDSWYYY